MPAKPFVVTPKEYAPALDIVGEHVTVLASGEATEGYEVFLQRGPEGSGPPPHSHPWDESFYLRRRGTDRFRHRSRVDDGDGGHARPPSRRDRPLVPLRRGGRRDGLDDIAARRL
jgi:hypothetical protein